MAADRPPSPSPRHPQDGGGTVGDLRRGAGGVDAVGEHGLERGQTRLRRVPQALVPVHDLELAGGAVRSDDGRLDGEHLTVEATLGPGLCRLALRLEAQRVGVRAADRVLLGDALSRTELVRRIDQGEPARERPARDR